MSDVIKQVKDAKRRLFSVLIAEADKLDVPFSNAPDQSPWTRSVKPAMKALDGSLMAVAEQVAALQRELAEARADANEAEAIGANAVYTARTTHIREAHSYRPVVGDCDVCQALVPLSAAMPSRPDDPEEIRRLAESMETET